MLWGAGGVVSEPVEVTATDSSHSFLRAMECGHSCPEWVSLGRLAGPQPGLVENLPSKLGWLGYLPVGNK